MVPPTRRWAGDGYLRRRLEDRGAKHIPASKKVLQGPVTGKEISRYSVFVRLIADFYAEKVWTQNRGCIRYFFGSQGRSRGSEIDTVEAQPAGRLQEAGQRLDFDGRDL